MIVLDENISGAEEAKLVRRRIRCRTIGVHLAKKGTDDADLIPVLLSLPRPTFFTQDRGFWDSSLQHPGYCLAWLDCEENEQAQLIRAFLRHPDFKTHAQRLGKVAHVHADGVSVHASHHGSAEHIPWLRTV